MMDAALDMVCSYPCPWSCEPLSEQVSTWSWTLRPLILSIIEVPGSVRNNLRRGRLEAFGSFVTLFWNSERLKERGVDNDPQ